MTNFKAHQRFCTPLLAAFGVVCALSFAPATASAANPVAKPKVVTSAKLPKLEPSTQTYVLRMGKATKQVKAKRIKVVTAAGGKTSKVYINGKLLQQISGVVAVAIATGGNNNDEGGQTAQYSQTSTTTQLPGGGTRTDIDHGDGSSTTIIHDPNGGKNGGSRTTTSTTDSEGNTTTITTTTDGSDGSSTTTVSTSP